MSKIKLSRLWYIVITAIWVLISAHLFYNYIEYTAQKIPVKGGVIFQATLKAPVYLPYMSFDPQDRYIQNILFKSCLKATTEGINIIFHEDMCDVKTKDYQTFLIKMKPDLNWSDDVPITNKDLLFTYQDIIQKNIRNIDTLQPFKNIKIEYLTGKELLKVTFPSPSIDNQIFFNFPILPAHILKDTSQTTYLSMMSVNLVNSSCAKIKKGIQDVDSLVLDLENCPDWWVNNLQLKKFATQNDLLQYIKKHTKQEYVDFYISRTPISGFNTSDSIINTFYVVFFNTQGKIDTKGRHILGGILNNYFLTGEQKFLQQNWINYLIKDHFIFNHIPSSTTGELLDYLSGNFSVWVPAPTPITWEQLKQKEQPQFVTIDQNPFLIKLSQSQAAFYYIPKLPVKQTLHIYLPAQGIKVGIQANGGVEYFPKSFKKDNFLYNLAPWFGNIKIGKNTYTINLYDQDQKIATYQITLWVQNKPSDWQQEPQPKQKTTPKLIQIKKPIKVIYLPDEVSNVIISNTKKIAQNLQIADYFEYIPLTGESLRQTLSSWNYDIFISPLKMGLKKDISPLLISKDPLINPSRYSNTVLASLVNQYRISSPQNQQQILQEINKLYARELPFVILGKKIIQFQVNPNSNIYIPLRLYDLSLLEERLKKVRLLYKPQLDKEKLYNVQNFFNFIYSSLGF